MNSLAVRIYLKCDFLLSFTCFLSPFSHFLSSRKQIKGTFLQSFIKNWRKDRNYISFMGNLLVVLKVFRLENNFL